MILKKGKANFDGGLWQEKDVHTAQFTIEGNERAIVFGAVGSFDADVLDTVRRGDDLSILETIRRERDGSIKSRSYALVTLEARMIFVLAATLKDELPANQVAQLSRSDLLTLAAAIYAKHS